MLYHWNVRHASHSPYVATVQTISFCKSISVIEQFWVFRAVVFWFFLPFLLCLSAFLLFCASMNFVCVGGDYIPSVSEFLLTWKGYRSLWAVGIAHKWYWMLSNFTDKYIWWKLDKTQWSIQYTVCSKIGEDCGVYFFFSFLSLVFLYSLICETRVENPKLQLHGWARCELFNSFTSLTKLGASDLKWCVHLKPLWFKYIYIAGVLARCFNVSKLRVVTIICKEMEGWEGFDVHSTFLPCPYCFRGICFFCWIFLLCWISSRF